MRNVVMMDELRQAGGTELAPLSTTPDMALAARFAAGRAALLFAVCTTDASGAESFMLRGASLQWLSTMPHEREVLYPPCTYLKPTGRTSELELEGGATCTVVEVTPFV